MPRISDELKDAIRRAYHSEKFSTQTELAKHFGVSLATARKYAPRDAYGRVDFWPKPKIYRYFKKEHADAINRAIECQPILADVVSYFVYELSWRIPFQIGMIVGDDTIANRIYEQADDLIKEQVYFRTYDALKYLVNTGKRPSLKQRAKWAAGEVIRANRRRTVFWRDSEGNKHYYQEWPTGQATVGKGLSAENLFYSSVASLSKDDERSELWALGYEPAFKEILRNLDYEALWEAFGEADKTQDKEDEEAEAEHQRARREIETEIRQKGKKALKEVTNE